MPAPTIVAVLRGGAFAASIGVAFGIARVLCPDAGPLTRTNAPLEPPKEVFGIVWPILFVTTGVSWSLAGSGFDALYATFTLLCCLWVPLYKCARAYRLAALTLAAAVVVSSCTLAVLTPRAVSQGLLAPLVAWLSLATYLNVYRAASGV